MPKGEVCRKAGKRGSAARDFIQIFHCRFSPEGRAALPPPSPPRRPPGWVFSTFPHEYRMLTQLGMQDQPPAWAA